MPERLFRHPSDIREISVSLPEREQTVDFDFDIEPFFTDKVVENIDQCLYDLLREGLSLTHKEPVFHARLVRPDLFRHIFVDWGKFRRQLFDNIEVCAETAASEPNGAQDPTTLGKDAEMFKWLFPDTISDEVLNNLRIAWEREVQELDKFYSEYGVLELLRYVKTVMPRRFDEMLALVTKLQIDIQATSTRVIERLPNQGTQGKLDDLAALACYSIEFPSVREVCLKSPVLAETVEQFLREMSERVSRSTDGTNPDHPDAVLDFLELAATVKLLKYPLVITDKTIDFDPSSLQERSKQPEAVELPDQRKY